MNTTLLIFSIAEFFGLWFLVSIISQLLHGEHVIKKETVEEGKKPRRYLSFEEIGEGSKTGAVIGLIAGGINFFVPQLARWLSAVEVPEWVLGIIGAAGLTVIIFLMIKIAVQVTLKDGEDGASKIKEFVCLIIIQLMLFFTAKATASIAALPLNGVLDKIVWMIPIVSFVVVLGWFGFYYFEWKPRKHPRFRSVFKWVPLAIAAIVVILVAVNLNPPWQTAERTHKTAEASKETNVKSEETKETETSVEEPTEAPAPMETEAPTATEEPAKEPTTEETLEYNWRAYQEVVDAYPWLTFHNFALQSDGDEDNNSNFGPNRYNKDWSAMDYYRDMKQFDESDPLVLVAHVAATDAARDTSLVGDYYDGNDHDWARTMNALIEDCLADEKDFMHLSDVYLNLLAHEVRGVQLVYVEDIQDQMYITPYTYSGIPKLVASKTHQSGHLLLVTFKRKGGEENDVTVGFRVECAYQPVGIIDIMNLPDTPIVNPPEHGPTPEPTSTPGPGPNPTVTPTPGPTVTPTPTPGPDTPTPTPTPTPSNPKNPERAPEDNTEPGDGPDPNTNNPEDPRHSTEDQEENSDHGTTYDEYREDQEKMEETNENQRQGGDSNEPSSQPSTSDNTDNNGSQGNGNGGIDQPTERQDAETVDKDSASDGRVTASD